MNPAFRLPSAERGRLPLDSQHRHLVGHGTSPQHHGEILQGVRRTPSGESIPCLITFPNREPGSHAQFRSNQSGCLTVWPEQKLKAARAAAICLVRFGCDVSGHLSVDCGIPVGQGLGSSTCDVVSAIVAVSNAFGLPLPAQEIAYIAVEAETAIDPIMFDDVVLFAQRRGEVLESFGSWFPDFTVFSINIEPQLSGVDTLSVPPPTYSAKEGMYFESLVNQARTAFACRDRKAIAEIATKSAEMNQARLPLRRFREVISIAEKRRALGVQISHSGTVAGILFDQRGAESDPGLLACVWSDLKRIGVVLRCVFRSG